MFQALYQVLYAYNLIESFLPSHIIGTMIVPILKMRKPRFSDVRWFPKAIQQVREPGPRFLAQSLCEDQHFFSLAIGYCLTRVQVKISLSVLHTSISDFLFTPIFWLISDKCWHRSLAKTIHERCLGKIKHCC